MEELDRLVVTGHVLRADQGQDAVVHQQVGSPPEELALDTPLLARGIVVRRIAPDEGEGTEGDRTTQKVGRGQSLAIREQLPHHGCTILRQLDRIGNRPEPLGQLQECLAFSGTRVQDQTFTLFRWSDSHQHGSHCFGRGSIVAAFDLGHEPGHRRGPPLPATVARSAGQAQHSYRVRLPLAEAPLVRASITTPAACLLRS